MNNSSPYTAAMTGCTFKLKEPYLANGFQMTNLVRFMELMVRVGDCKVFKLITKLGNKNRINTAEFGRFKKSV